MDNLGNLCSSYFKAGNHIDFKKCGVKKSLLSLATVFSYFTVVIPLVMAALGAVSLVHKRVQQIRNDDPGAKQVVKVANPILVKEASQVAQKVVLVLLIDFKDSRMMMLA